MHLNKFISIILACLIILLIFFGYNTRSYPDLFYNAKDLDSVNIVIDQSSENSSNKITVTTKSDISMFLNCLKKIRKNNKQRVLGIQTAPLSFTVQYNFSNGETKQYKHIIYKSAYKNPLLDFLLLDSVIMQTNSLFLYDVDDISYASINYTNSSTLLSKRITNKLIIEYLLKFGRDDALINKSYTESNCGITFYDTSNNPQIASFININVNTYKLDALFLNYPEIAEFLSVAKENEFK